MTTTRTALRREETAKPDDLYMSFELGDKQWKLSVGDGRNTVSRFRIAAGDQGAGHSRARRPDMNSSS